MGKIFSLMNKRLRTILFLGFFLLVGCWNDAPHDNPLDPVNDNGLLELSGMVLTFYQPHSPISGATLLLQPGDVLIRTGTDGSFRFDNLHPGTYTLYCQAAGYARDSLWIELNDNRQQNFYLNGLPYFSAVQVTSHHISRWFPTADVYYLEINVRVSDRDGVGDVKAVYCEIPFFAHRDTLDPGFNAGEFRKTLFEADLGVNSLHQLIGHPIFLYVEDNPGALVSSDPLYIARIIEAAPTLLGPIELETVPADSIHFRWQAPGIPFDHSFTIELFAINAGIATNVATIADIPATNSDWLYRSSLPPGDYYWTISVVDAFGNSSRSKEGVFRIQ